MSDTRACGDAAGALRWRIRVALTLAWTLLLYWLVVFPQARRELSRWERRARLIPDPTLRAHALHKLETEHLTAEGAAAFAILAAAGSRRSVVRLCVAFEVMYDYLDALAEQPVANQLANNRQLYRALGAAFAPATPLEDYYARNPQGDDAGYLHALVLTCRSRFARLRAHSSVLPALQRLTACADEAQSLHHAASVSGPEQLARWARARQPAGATVHWWELAAAAGSPLGIFALVAAASHRGTDPRAAEEIERAYFPWIAGLSWLLESLVDRDDDAARGEHSYIEHYRSPHELASRLSTIAGRAAADARGLPCPARHTLLLAGMVAMNLSHAGAGGAATCDVARAVQRAVGGPVAPLLAVLRLRRAAGG